MSVEPGQVFASMVLARCRGTRSNRKRCSTKVETAPGDAAGAYCEKHVVQKKSDDTTRRCDGMTKSGAACLLRVTRNNSADDGTFCHLHVGQRKSWIPCFGVDINGDRCKESVFWTPPFTQFCRQHSAQQHTFECSIINVSKDVLSMIFDYLEPEARVAFALASKSCADLARSWGANRNVSSSAKTRERVITVRRRGDVRLLDLSTFRGEVPRHRDGSEARQILLRMPYQYNELYDGEKPVRLTLPHDENCRCMGMALDMDEFEIPSWRTFSPFSELTWSKKLARTVQSAPWLFTEAPRCVACHKSLSAEIVSEWRNLRTHTARVRMTQGRPCCRNSNICRHRVKRMRQYREMFCSSCVTSGPSANIQWCQRCNGEPSATMLSRAYWTTQYAPDLMEQPQASQYIEPSPIATSFQSL